MTVFIWTARIGQIASTKDPTTIGYYKDKFDQLKPNWKIPPSHETGVPFIMG